MHIEDIINRFQNVKKIGDRRYQCSCSAHQDSKPSLTISEEDNKILMYCHAGCDIQKILASVGLQEKDLFNNEVINNMTNVIEKEYIYTDEENRVLYKVVRYIPKRFVQAQYINGSWQYTMQNAQYVPYNLPNVKKSEIIYWVEGEKDADNINKLGLVATTTVGGASGFNKNKEKYISYFKNKTVYIIPDNDEAGRKYAENIYKALIKVTRKIKILDLKSEISDLGEKQDISDVIEKLGNEKTIEILEKLINNNDLFEYSGQTLSKELLEEILNRSNIKVGYNEITKDIDIEGLPEEYSSENAETILPIYLKELLKKYSIKASKSYIEDLLILIFDSHRYNPVINMLKNNEWDKKDRFHTLFEIMNITEELDKILIRKWFWQTVAMAFNGYDKKKPYGIEGVLTLQGPQGCGKTRFCRNIALKTEWFTEGATVDMKVKDSLILASKGFIVELGEVDSTIRKKQADLKSFLSNTVDEIRVPYGRKSIKKPRRTNFVATVNPTEFLSDETGNRRFFTIKIKNIDNDRLENLGNKWIEQLWLQAYNEIKDNINMFRLSSEERKELEKRNHNFTELSPCEEELTLHMDFSGEIKEYWNSIEINDELLNGKYSSPIIGKAIAKLKNKFPNFIDIKNTNRGKIYTLPIKKSGGSEKKK